MTKVALEALVRFLPTFERPDFKAGEWRGGEEIEPGVLSMPAVHYSDTVTAFIDTIYKHDCVSADLDWPKWAQSSEAARLRDDETVLDGATSEQLRRLLTVCIRQDRFSEGALLESFHSGLIVRILRRAAAILEEKHPC
jgi:hypothetical protein